MRGKVFLVGAGPGDPDLLTLKSHRLLRTADVVLHDGLVTQEILQLISPAARVVNVGKRSGAKHISQEGINFLMVTMAASGMQVVRLQGGDPLIFGRAGEELAALRMANIECEIVPGVTAALGAAARAQIPLTDRRYSSALVFLTGHRADGEPDAEWPQVVKRGATLAIYMPGRDYAGLASRLRRAGISGETPCAIISRATTAREEVHISSVADLAAAPLLPAPALLVVGEVVRFAKVGNDLAQTFFPGLDVQEVLSQAGQARSQAHEG